MRFAANISTMFTEMIIPDRFNEAKASGFAAVEAQWLYEYGIPELVEARANAEIPIVLMNSPKRDSMWFYETEPFGIACIPGLEVDFAKTINTASQYCNYLQCNKLHIMAGTVPENYTSEECEGFYLQNLGVAAEMLELYNIVGVIEPICGDVLPNYFLNSFANAVKYIEHVGSKNIRLLLDVYHLYNIEGNVEEGLKKYLPYAAHVQISQSPERNDPLEEGDIDYEKVFQILKDNGYKGDVGLEYTPSSDKPDFEWIKRFDHESSVSS